MLNTPFSFMASAVSGLPTVIQNAQWFYDANETTTFTDQSGNGNDGTETTGGSGGGSSITHTVTGNGNYWDFVASNPASEQKYVNTNTNIGGVTDWSLVAVVANTDNSTNAQFFHAQDGGSDNLVLFTDRSNERIFARASDGVRRDLVGNVMTINQMRMFILTYLSTGPAIYLYENNSLTQTNGNSISLNITANSNIGLPFANSTTTNEMYVGAMGFFPNYYMDSTDRTELYDYYNNIYSFV